MKIAPHILYLWTFPIALRIKAICLFLNTIKVVCPLKMANLMFQHEIVSSIVLLHVFRKSTLSPSLIAVSVNSVRTFFWEDAVIQDPLSQYCLLLLHPYSLIILCLFFFFKMDSQRQFWPVKAYSTFLSHSIHNVAFWNTLQIASQKGYFIEWTESEPSFTGKTICIWA